MKKNKFWYVIKDDTSDDFSERFKPISTNVLYDHEAVAEEVAEQYYSDDPSDPRHFEIEVGVKDESGSEQWFKVTAEPDIQFYAREVKHTEGEGE